MVRNNQGIEWRSQNKKINTKCEGGWISAWSPFFMNKIVKNDVLGSYALDFFPSFFQEVTRGSQKVKGCYSQYNNNNNSNKKEEEVYFPTHSTVLTGNCNSTCLSQGRAIWGLGHRGSLLFNIVSNYYNTVDNGWEIIESLTALI